MGGKSPRLSEYIEHHVKEEHNELFPEIRKTRLDLQALGEQLRQRKEQPLQQIGPCAESVARVGT